MLKLKWYNNDTSLYNKQLEIEAASRIKGAYTYTGQLKLHEIPTSLRLVKYIVSAGKLRYYVGVNKEILPSVYENNASFEIENPPEDFYTVDFPTNFPITDEKEAEALGLELNEGSLVFTDKEPSEDHIIRFCIIKHKYRIKEEIQIGSSVYTINRINITALQAAMYDLTNLLYRREVLEQYTYRNIGDPILVRDVILEMPTLPDLFIIEENRDID